MRAGGTDVFPLLIAEKNVFKLIHARIGEQQGGVIGRDQRGAFDDMVLMAFEIFQELLTNFISGQWVTPLIRFRLLIFPSGREPILIAASCSP